MKLKVKLCGGIAPTRSDGAGWDLYAKEDLAIDPLSRLLVPLGIQTEFDRGHVGLIMDRSGMANKGMHRFGGVIDCNYRGEWGAILWNSTGMVFRAKRGDRIAQVVFLVLPEVDLEMVDEVSDTQRGAGGFGSTGV